MSEKYSGQVGPADAMDALSQEFGAAYRDATAMLLQAVIDFERRTGRLVDSIALERIDVTQIESPVRQTLRQASLHFLPKPGEVAW